MKRFWLFLALITSLPFLLASPTQAGKLTPVGQVSVPSLGLTRTIYATQSANPQRDIDACLGAINLRSIAGVTWLAAHRTSCGNRGFGGVETLTPGARARVAINGRTKNYVLIDSAIGTVSSVLEPPPFMTDLVLQTSRDATSVYLKYFAEVDRASPATGRGTMLRDSESICVDSGGSEGEFALVNLTPVGSSGGGYGTLYPAGGTPGDTSAVNWDGPDPSPNTTLTQIGQRGRICIGTHGAHTDIVADVIAIAPADTFRWSAQRLVDTRNTNAPVIDSKICFNLPGTAGDWAVLNVTPIGLTNGYGVIESAQRQVAISNVNYFVGLPNPNLVIAQIDQSGQLCYRSNGAAHVVIDLEATADVSTFWGTPVRQIDTRLDLKPAAAHSCFETAFANKIVWALINLTPDPSGGPGFGRLHNGHKYPDITSDVNYVNRPDPNLTAVQVGIGEQLCITSMGAPTEWIVDVMAVANADRFREPTRRRVLDTRLVK